MEKESEELKLTVSKYRFEYAGYYSIGSFPQTCFHIFPKPNFINRFFCKLFLGWEWKDTQKTPTENT